MVGTHGSACACAHDLSVPLPGTQWLDPYIDKGSIACLGEESVGSGLALFRAYMDRLTDPSPRCRCSNEEDIPGLVVTVSFTCPVKISGVTVITSSSAPLHLYANLVDPETVEEVAPKQTIDSLVEDWCGVIEYPLRVAKFSQINSLTLWFMEPSVELFYIGLRGIASGDQRRAVVTVYESRANVADHPGVKEMKFASSQF